MGQSSCPEDRYVFRDAMYRLEALGLLCWLLKDLGWALLLCPLSWPAAFMALCLEGYSLRIQWSAQAPQVRIHQLATFIWLVGNVVWMTFEFVFAPLLPEEHGRKFRWYQGPLVRDGNDRAYDIGVHIAQAIFAAGLALLALVYLHEVVRHCRQRAGANPEGQQPTPSIESHYVFGLYTPELYQWLFIGPWILKDLFWSFDCLVPGLIFGFIAGLLFLDYIRRYGGLFHFAELCWLVGNCFWIVAELGFQERSQAVRIEAGAILLAGATAVVITFVSQTFADTGTKRADPVESSPLLN